jgi:hypothetical protein
MGRFSVVNVLQAPIEDPDNRRRRYPSPRQVIPRPVHLMPPFVQDRYDADLLVRETPPVHEMMRVPEVEAFDPERGRDGA